MRLMSMLWITSSSATSKLTFIGENNGNVVDKVNVVDKANRGVSESGPRFFIFGTKLTFIKLSQTFCTAPILYHFDLKFHVQIDINALSYAIDRVFNKLTSNNLNQ